MPFFLIIVLAPKVAFLTDNGDVIVRRNPTVAVASVTSSKMPPPAQQSTLTKDALENADGTAL